MTRQILFTIILIWVALIPLSAATIYVKHDALGSNNGSSWADAYTNLQTAITAANSGDQIWIAKGTYKPTTTTRTIYFVMKTGVSLYGGFAGTETAIDQRDIINNETILSGEIGTASADDNTHMVCVFNIVNTITMDGFTITGGYSNGGSIGSWTNDGGGIMINSGCSSLVFNNLIIKNNYALWNGSGVFINSSGSVFTNCLFVENTGAVAVTVYNSSATFTNCTFAANQTQAISSAGNYASVTLNNCIINDEGESMFTNSGCSLTLNYCCYTNSVTNNGTFTATNNNIIADPEFVGSGSYVIKGSSPCTDAGSDAYNSTTTDIRGTNFARKLNKSTGAVGTIDMGAYEYKLNNDPLPVELTSFVSSVTGNTVSLNWVTATEVENYGFEVERSSADNNWMKIGFVAGKGNANTQSSYAFTDANLSTGTYSYRLKQIDLSGNFEYSNVVSASVNGLPTEFTLGQNYPNPFNPSTTIQFALPTAEFVTLSLYNALGELVNTVVSANYEAGTHTVQLSAEALNSGLYFYTISAGNFTSTKKMLLVK